MKGIRFILISCFLLLTFQSYGKDHKFGVQTNAFQWAYYGTMNVEGSLSLSQHFSAYTGLRFNPWKYRVGKHDMELYNNQFTIQAGARWWPWYVYSGWWAGAGLQFSDYKTTGIRRHALNTGKAFGATFSFGYTFMLTQNFNIDVGAGVWAGRIFDYTLYCCPKCMDVRESGNRNFFGVNDILISLVYVF